MTDQLLGDKVDMNTRLSKHGEWFNKAVDDIREWGNPVSAALYKPTKPRITPLDTAGGNETETYSSIEALLAQPSTALNAAFDAALNNEAAWNSIAGNEQAKALVHHSIVCSIKTKKKFLPVQSVLLFGSSGTGKTMMAEIAAQYAGRDTSLVNFEDILQKSSEESAE